MQSPILCLALASTGLLALPPTQAAPSTFYMDEITQYSDISMCTNANVNTVTASLATAMRSDGWTGSRYVNASAWPQDFRDLALDSTNGLDHYYGDASTLSVFAGHGGPGLLTFRPRNGICTTSAGTNMAFGYGSTGGNTAVGIWLSCEMLGTGLLDESTSAYRRMNIRQSLGWINSIGIGDNEARDFYTATRTISNKDAWLNEMQGNGRKPIVLTATTSSSASTCWFFHERESLGKKVVDHLNGNWAYRCWEWIN